MHNLMRPSQLGLNAIRDIKIIWGFSRVGEGGQISTKHVVNFFESGNCKSTRDWQVGSLQRQVAFLKCVMT